MIKGLNLVERVKHEIKHNAEYHNQSVKFPVKDLELLIELAESNQYRLDLELMNKIAKYAGALHKIANSKEDSSCNELAMDYEVIASQALYD